MASHILITHEDCPSCDGIGRVFPAWDILPPGGDTLALVDCPACGGVGKVEQKIVSEDDAA